jgi:hypothetical protein
MIDAHRIARDFQDMGRREGPTKVFIKGGKGTYLSGLRVLFPREDVDRLQHSQSEPCHLLVEAQYAHLRIL